MRRKSFNPLITLATIVASFFLTGSNALEHERNIFHQKRNYIYIDDEVTEVYFNDGDTFKVIGEKDSARIAGYNTLENYGPVHQWHGLSTLDLFDLAQEAAKKARSGEWHCVSKDEEDSYGRLLVECDDLAIALIEQGLAHAYSINKTPAKEIYLRAQAYAQENHLGMWAKGVPEYIITSLHSAHEPGRSHYNRLISTDDGHTEQWSHHTVYRDCELVCYEEHSCMVYVSFGNRYGKNRAECLDVDDISDIHFGEVL